MGEERGVFDSLGSVGGIYREVEDIGIGGVVGFGIEVSCLVRVIL